MQINNISNNSNFGIRLNRLEKAFSQCFNTSQKDYLCIKDYLSKAGYDGLKLESVSNSGTDSVFLRFMDMVSSERGTVVGFDRKIKPSATVDEIKEMLVNAAEHATEWLHVKK